MVVCTTLASICVLSGLVKPLDIPSELYIKKIFPIAACYAGALWTSNAAYAISSVSFAQARVRPGIRGLTTHSTIRILVLYHKDG